jgi:UDP-2,3-diacylglucosamine pyrophosphatase LpxH
MKTIVISDLHIGSLETNYNALYTFLSTLDCDRLILAGDVWELWEQSPESIRKQYKYIIDWFYSFMSRGVKIDYVLGNHDNKYNNNPIIELCGVDKVILEQAGRRIIIIHGHQFDSTMTRLTQRPLAKINYQLRKHLGLSYKSIHTDGRRAIIKIRERARAHIGLDYDTIIIGHTHAPEYVPRTDNRPEFINAGDWKVHNTFVVIEEDVRLYRFDSSRGISFCIP